jgi:sugar lactone lactonase YvrE
MTQPKVLLEGLAFPESPRWHEGRLWLCDWMSQQLVAVDLNGKSEVITQVQSFPFCIDFLPDGRLLIVSAQEQQLFRMESDGSLKTHADLSVLSAHPWNDIVVDGRGNAYVGNIGFQFPGGEFSPGTVALSTPDGLLQRVADGIAFPNGLAVTRDNSTLIVAESYGNRLTAFDIDAHGKLSGRRTWADLGEGAPDGICLDADNAIWYADVPNKRCVRVREGGEVLETVTLDRGCFACALGGPDGKTLFLVANEWRGIDNVSGQEANGQVLVTDAPAPGAGWP